MSQGNSRITDRTEHVEKESVLPPDEDKSRHPFLPVPVLYQDGKASDDLADSTYLKLSTRRNIPYEQNPTVIRVIQFVVDPALPPPCLLLLPAAKTYVHPALPSLILPPLHTVHEVMSINHISISGTPLVTRKGRLLVLPCGVCTRANSLLQVTSRAAYWLAAMYPSIGKAVDRESSVRWDWEAGQSRRP